MEVKEEGEKDKSPEEIRKGLFRQQAEEMLAKGKERGLKPSKPDEQWVKEYVGAMEGLHKLITEINKDFKPEPVEIGNFDSSDLTVGFRYARTESPTNNVGSVPLIIPPKELPKT